MFIPRVNSKQKRVKRTQNAKQKTGTEATRLPSRVARRGGQSTLSVTTLLAVASGPARRGGQNMPPVATMLAVASSSARRGGQTWLSVTTLLALRASLLAVASTDSWLSRKSHSSSQNPNFEPLNPKFDFQNLPNVFRH